MGPLWLLVTLSLALVAVVLWFMWRLPLKPGAYFVWAPMLALVSAWSGLLALIASTVLWLWPRPEALIAAVLLGLDPLAVGTGTLVLWIYRGEADEPTILSQKNQARVGIGLGLLAVSAGYVFVFLHKAPGW